jgi:hypothetical protein
MAIVILPVLAAGIWLAAASVVYAPTYVIGENHAKLGVW